MMLDAISRTVVVVVPSYVPTSKIVQHFSRFGGIAAVFAYYVTPWSIRAYVTFESVDAASSAFKRHKIMGCKTRPRRPAVMPPPAPFDWRPAPFDWPPPAAADEALQTTWDAVKSIWDAPEREPARWRGGRWA